jgi:hypothetical protein
MKRVFQPLPLTRSVESHQGGNHVADEIGVAYESGSRIDIRLAFSRLLHNTIMNLDERGCLANSDFT